MPAVLRATPCAPSRSGGPHRGVAGWWGVVLAVVWTAPLGAQGLADPLVPRGRVRLDFAPSFASWDTRFGRWEVEGSTVDGEEALGSDLTDPTGRSVFPGIATLEESLRALTDEGAYTARLGEVRGAVTTELSRIDAGVRIGVFDWLAVGATVPWVRGRSAVDVAFRPDPDADLGLNPTLTDGTPVSLLFVGLQDAAAAAAARAAALCGGTSGAPCVDARALADRVAAFSSRTQAAYLASPFFPRAGSPVAAGLSSALASLDAALVAAGLPGVGASMVYATDALDTGTLVSLPTNPAAGLGGSRLRTVDGLWTLGDVELTAAVRLLEGEVRDSGAAEPRVGYTLMGGALLRLGTGEPDDPDIFFDVGSGDGQWDVEGRLDGSLRVGTRVDIRGAFRYGAQDGTTLVRRVAPHELVLAPTVTRRVVRWTPGSYTVLDLSPRWSLSPVLSLSLEYRRFHKAEDAYELVGEQPAGLPAVDVADLVRESETTLHEGAIGLRYNTVPAWRAGEDTAPLEVGLRLISAMAGSGGRTPRATRLEFGVSLFRRFWGEP